jgi:hypothetical protein
MSDQPILFKGEMVRAVLEGRKTQTRRIAWEFDIHHKLRKSQKDIPVQWAGAVHPARESGWVSWFPGDQKGLAEFTKKQYAKGIECPYGRVGDRLWCRETWRTFERPEDGVDGILFRADNHFQPVENTRDAADQWVIAHDNGKHCDQWRPSIFMRRWMSRLTLEIVNVRVQRLQEISMEDCIAEGVQIPVTRQDCPQGKARPLIRLTGKFPPVQYLPSEGDRTEADFYRAEFASLWNEINGKRAAWESNPWVWAITFKRIEASTREEAV